MTDSRSDRVERHAGRVLALVGHCPVGKSLKLRDGERFVQCTRTGQGAELILKMGLRSDVSGAALLHARFRVRFGAEGEPGLSLHHLEGRRETASLTGRQEKYLAALLTWAEQVLPTAAPVARTIRTPAWHRSFAELYHFLSGRSLPVARRRLGDGFFMDQQDAPPAMRIEALLDMLREEGSVALVDWEEETVEDILCQLAEQRLGARCPADRAMLSDRGYDVVMLEDGSDHYVMALVARDQVATVERLLADIAPSMTCMIGLAAGAE